MKISFLILVIILITMSFTTYIYPVKSIEHGSFTVPTEARTSLKVAKSLINSLLYEFFCECDRYPYSLEEMYSHFKIDPLKNPETELCDWITIRKSSNFGDYDLIESGNEDLQIVRVKVGNGQLKRSSVTVCLNYLNTKLHEYYVINKKYPTSLDDLYTELNIEPILDPITGRHDWLTKRLVTVNNMSGLLVSESDKLPIVRIQQNSFANRLLGIFGSVYVMCREFLFFLKTTSIMLW